MESVLLENYEQTLVKLEDLIDNKLTCSIDYRGERIGDILDGIRIIEPYVVGKSSKGEPLLRAWLIKGMSRTGRIDPRLVPGWRLFRIDRIRSISPTLQKFTIPRIGYNSEDSGMTEISFAAIF